MEDSIHTKNVYRSLKNAADGFLDEDIYDEKRYRREEMMQEEAERDMHTSRRTKKQKDYAAIKITLFRIIASGVLFLAIYCIAEFEPSFIPFSIKDIKEALSGNLFGFIK